MENLLKRLELVEKYCSEEYNNLYYKLSKCRDKAIKMSYAEYMSEEKEHDYSNLYSCIYDFKKENNVLESMEELMQLMKDIDFNINKKFQVHNFKVANHIPLCKGGKIMNTQLTITKIKYPKNDTIEYEYESMEGIFVDLRKYDLHNEFNEVIKENYYE